MPRRSTPERPTYTAIAERLGLSVSAVSLVMKDPLTPRVSPDNRQRILAYVESGAVRLRRAGPGPVAFVIDREETLRSRFIGDLLLGAQAACRQAGRAMVVETWRPDLALVLQQGGIEGVLLALPLELAEVRALSAQWPCLLLNQDVADTPCDAVVSDERRGIRLALEHLVALGHRRICYLGYEAPGVAMAEWRWGYDHEERRRGFREAAADAGLAEAGIRLLTTRQQSGQPPCSIAGLVAAWTDPATRPTAVVAFDDQVALELARAVRAAGWRLPADLSIIGHNDLDIARHADPPLTTVVADLASLGTQGMDLLRSRLAGERHPPRRLTIPCRLEVRASTAPPAGPGR